MDQLIVTAINFDNLQAALKVAPIETWRFAKTEMDRFAKRVRRKTIQGMAGRPAVRGPADEFGRAVSWTAFIELCGLCWNEE